MPLFKKINYAHTSPVEPSSSVKVGSQYSSTSARKRTVKSATDLSKPKTPGEFPTSVVSTGSCAQLCEDAEVTKPLRIITGIDQGASTLSSSAPTDDFTFVRPSLAKQDSALHRETLVGGRQMSNGTHTLSSSTATTPRDSASPVASLGKTNNSSAIDKFILSWDPTDPEEWTIQRVVAWLKYHEFPDNWITVFKRYQLCGQKFVKLLAYDNFALYEVYLRPTGTASFNRFQEMLKTTMSENVTNNQYMRQMSGEKTGRRSIDSLRSRYKSPLDKSPRTDASSTGSRSASESAAASRGGVFPSRTDRDSGIKSTQQKSHQKTKSASSLYRKSLISLKGSGLSSSSSSGVRNPGPGIKLKIPTRPTSIIELAGPFGRPLSPPISPSYPNIFKRHHRPSSSEPNAGNSFFGPIHNSSSETSSGSPGAVPSASTLATTTGITSFGNNKVIRQNDSANNNRNSDIKDTTDSKSTKYNKITLGSAAARVYSSVLGNSEKQTSTTSSYQSKSNETALKIGKSLVENFSKSSLRQETRPRSRGENKAVDSSTALSSNMDEGAPSLVGSRTPKQNPNVRKVCARSDESSKPKQNLRIDTKLANRLSPGRVLNSSYSGILEKYQPKINKEDKSKNDIHILITRDNKTYTLLKLNVSCSVNSLLELISSKLGINHAKITIHMTDFGGSPGLALPEDILDILIKNSFANTTAKFYIKEISNIPQRMRMGTLSGDSPVQSLKSKQSSQSLAQSLSHNMDDVSIVTSTSDMTSFDEHSSLGVRGYPQTPSYYYDGDSSFANAPSDTNGDVGTSSVATNDNVNGVNSPIDIGTNKETNTHNADLNYWTFKDSIRRDTSPPRSIPQVKPISTPINNFHLKLPNRQVADTSNSGSETESHKSPTPPRRMRHDGRGSTLRERADVPHMDLELEPRREAPKPPVDVSPQKRLSLAAGNTIFPRLRRISTKKPQNNAGNSARMSQTEKPATVDGEPDSIVTSYTPATTHVLVPQPYKGASEGLRRKKSGENIPALVHQKSVQAVSGVNGSISLLKTKSSVIRRGSSRRIVSSTSAADVFEENEIDFANAPRLSDEEDNGSSSGSDSSSDIIWSNKRESHTNDTLLSHESNDTDYLSAEDNDTTTVHKELDEKYKLGRKMTLRPPPEVVYQNLEQFFPAADLDKPVVEGIGTPTSPSVRTPLFSTNSSTTSSLASNMQDLATPQKPFQELDSPLDAIVSQTPINRLKTPKRTKTIRTIAHEAGEARKRSIKLKRTNTKMWGTRMVEVTEKPSVKINKSRNSKGQYKEFAWMKGEMIGKGSFGAVYLCLNVTTGEMMAVKQVEVPKYSTQDENILNTVEALRAEVSTLKDLDHENIVQYLGFENKDNIYSLFLEYVAGGSVGSLIRMYGRFSDAMNRHITTQVLKGLAYLHSRGILHRDMKADNLLLDQDGVCKISDFGISRKSNDIYSNSDMIMRGTVFWMAPEMVDTKQGYSAKVDIWSLGCVVLEMYAGKRPWSNLEVVAAMFKIGKTKSAPPIPDDTLPLISADGKSFLDACFMIDPDLRPTADQLLSHPFCTDNEGFDFKKTELYEFIRSNNKINSTKLRASPHEQG